MTLGEGPNALARPKAPGFQTAPIVEAVIDVRFADALTEQELASVRDALTQYYPTMSAAQRKEISIEIETESVQVGSAETFRGEGEDNTELLLLRPEGIATSQLAPYRSWEDFYGRFQRDLLTLMGVVGFRALSRMAVRNINRIDIAPGADGLLRYEDYLAVRPQIPSELDPLNEFQMALVRPVPEVGGTARIGVGNHPPAVAGRGSFVVDVDLWRDQSLPESTEELADLFERFRITKNALYRACLTEHALAEFT